MTAARVLPGLRALAESLPAGTAIPVPAGMLRELLDGRGADADSPPGVT
nr:hypothetical protein [Gemmatimonadales bacterium]